MGSTPDVVVNNLEQAVEHAIILHLPNKGNAPSNNDVHSFVHKRGEEMDEVSKKIATMLEQLLNGDRLNLSVKKCNIIGRNILLETRGNPKTRHIHSS